jgi:PAS domain S-box-containing protein
MSLRSYLTALTLATLLPVAIFAAIVGYFLVDHERDTFRRGAEERTQALLTAVDAELKGSIDTIQALSLVAGLYDGNLPYFRVSARRVLESQPHWANINLALPDRQRVLDLIAPEGAPLPPITDDGEIAILLRERKPVVAGMALGPTSKSSNFAVRVPVIRDGAIRYVLSAVVEPDSIGRLVSTQDLPAGWVAVVLDRNNRIVARSVESEKSRGQLASQSLRDALARAPSGWFRGSTIEGREVYTPYRRSEVTGWTFAMGIPAEAVDAAAVRAAWLLVLGLLGAIGLAIAFAHLVGRRISAPIASLAAATAAMARGQSIQIPDSRGVTEIRVLATALRAATQTQAALRASEERLRMVLGAGRMGNWEWNVRTGEVTWSTDLEAIHGMAPGSFAGTFAAFQKDIHPDDLNEVQRAVAQSMEHGRSEHHIEYRIIRPDGAVRWVEGRGKVFRDDSGTPVRLVGVCMDITDRKRAEEELRQAEERTRSVVDHVVDGIITIDERGAVETFNPAAERIFGYVASEVVGRNVNMLMPEPYRGNHDGYLANYLRTGQAKIIGSGREVEGRRKDGSIFPMDLAVSAFYIGSGRRFTGIVRDITERKQAEQALREADRAKDEFLAMLSHELRNPLAALTTAAHVLQVAEPGQTAAAQARGVVDRQTKHMARLIEDLLDISRVTMGKATLEREVLNLADVVSNVVQSWRAAGRLDGARMLLTAAPAWVNADRVRIEQIFSNLLDNALKFTPAAGRITVSVRQEGGDAVLEVSDEGEGIAPEVSGRMFELFAQGPRGLARSEGGMGIGLALVKRLAGMHGGSVSAASEGRGRGAVFTVRLPAVMAPERAREQQPVPAQKAAGPRRVLVIEDNDDTRQMLRATLALGGHEVREAADGATGLAAAAELRPEVALIDIGLPDIDGYEVARRLRSTLDGAIMLIALTGYGQAEDQRQALEAGFDLHLTKPVTPERLAQAIAALR